MQAHIKLDHQLLAVESEHTVHAMLELTAPPAAEGSQRPPLHLALVLDRSGSMHGPKLMAARESASFLARRLGPADQLALIDYDDEVRLLAPLGAVQPVLLAAIDRIESGGQTNLSGGWLKGREELQRTTDPGPRKILLLTDGLANVGIVDPAALQAMAGNAQAGGIGTTTIGFGAGFNEELLTAMADAGGGNAHFAATPDEAAGIFAAEFEGLMSLAAQNLSVEIRPSEQVGFVSVLNDYPIVEVPGGVQIQLGDAYAEERRRVVFELHIAQMAQYGVAKVADVVLRYVAVGEEIAAHELSLPITINMVSADEATGVDADPDVTDEVVVLKTARAQAEARRHADRGEFDQARSLLSSASEDLRRHAPRSTRSKELLDEADRLKAQATSLDAARYSPITSKQMHYRSHRSQRGRSSFGQKSGGSPLDRADRVKGSLVGLAFGDCLGAGVEGWSPARIASRYGTLRDFAYSPTAWTDDTQQALVLVESLVRTGSLDPQWIGSRFVEMSHPRGARFGLHRGTGRGFRAAVIAFEQDGDPMKSGATDRAGNGAAMRIAPAAVALATLPDEEFATAIAEVSFLTHREIRGVLGAMAVAWTAAKLSREPVWPLNCDRGPEVMGELADWLQHRADWLAQRYPGVVTAVDRRFELCEVLRAAWNRWDGGPTARLEAIEEAASKRRGEHTWPTEGFVLASVPSAIICALGSDGDFEETVVRAVNLGGDADTVGAMVGGMAGAAVGVSGIPLGWLSLAGSHELFAWSEALAREGDLAALPDLLELEAALCDVVRGH